MLVLRSFLLMLRLWWTGSLGGLFRRFFDDSFEDCWVLVCNLREDFAVEEDVFLFEEAHERAV